MEKTETPLLSIRNLKVTFQVDAGLLKAVDDFNLELYPGEVVGIVGESGSGKSVSMLSITGLLKSTQHSIHGRALFMGHDLLAMSQAALSKVRGKEIGFVFQNPMSSLNPTMQVGAQIAEGMLSHGVVSRSNARDTVISLLDRVGIQKPAQRFEAYPHELSGGMRQRVMIAMALSCNPKLLIADEPTTALDVSVEKQILELLLEKQHELGLAIIMITHNLPIALNTCSRLLVMYAGKQMETGLAHQIVANPVHPYTRALFASHLERGRRGTRIESIQGNIPPLTELPKGCRFHPRCALASEACRNEDPTTREVEAERDHQFACHHVMALGHAHHAH